jgi:hypothetical protein
MKTSRHTITRGFLSLFTLLIVTLSTTQTANATQKLQEQTTHKLDNKTLKQDIADNLNAYLLATNLCLMAAENNNTNDIVKNITALEYRDYISTLHKNHNQYPKNINLTVEILAKRINVPSSAEKLHLAKQALEKLKLNTSTYNVATHIISTKLVDQINCEARQQTDAVYNYHLERSNLYQHRSTLLQQACTDYKNKCSRHHSQYAAKLSNNNVVTNNQPSPKFEDSLNRSSKAILKPIRRHTVHNHVLTPINHSQHRPSTAHSTNLYPDKGRKLPPILNRKRPSPKKVKIKIGDKQ